MTAEKLRALVAALLERKPEEIVENQSLLDQGLDSIAIMRISSSLRRVGVPIRFRELAESPTLDDWAQLVASRYSPTAAVAKSDAGSVVEESYSTRATADSNDFPLSPVQQAYLIGRSPAMELGGVACHAYLEFGGRCLDPKLLENAFMKLLSRHEMLRAQFSENGTQRILAQSAWAGLDVHDLRNLTQEEAESRLLKIRQRLSHRLLKVGDGEVIDIALSQLPDATTRLHLNIDLLAADVHSIRILLRDLASMYDDPGNVPPPLKYSFRRYLSDLNNERKAQLARSRKYWISRLPGLPDGPQLPLKAKMASEVRPRFTRRVYRISAPQWKILQDRAHKYRLTPAMVLLTAYARVLASWSASSRFVINLPLFGREDLHPDVSNLVADFTSLMLLDIDMTKPKSFLEYANQVQTRFREDIEHVDYSAVDLLREASRLKTELQKAPVVFACNLDSNFIGAEVRRVLGDCTWMLSQTPQVSLDHQVYKDGEEVLLAWDAAEDLFLPGVLDGMFAQYQNTIDFLTRETDEWHGSLPQPAPRNLEITQTDPAPVPSLEDRRLLHDGFVASAEASPEQIAVIDAEGRSYSYGYILQSAQAVATMLLRNNCRKGDLVALVMEKGVDQIVAAVGILLAGCAYLPIETDQPIQRRNRILRDSGTRYLLTQSWLALGDLPGDLQLLTESQIDGKPKEWVPVRQSPEELAYVIYTSGSTGEPKGVMISHQSALNTVSDINRRFSVNKEDRVLALANLSFDLSVYDVFGTLAAGGAVVIPAQERRADPSHWVELIRRHQVSIWNSVPAQMHMLLQYLDSAGDYELASLRLALLSGDWIPVNLSERIRRYTNNIQLISLGGATEASIWSIFYPITEVHAEWSSIPYGTPLSNQTVQVLDDDLRRCPNWVSGELYIGGAGLSMGYIGDPEKTNFSFITHPVTGERLYRTGDLGRYRDDGVIEFLGRTDAQIKIRGQRIELGEVEAALEKAPEVACAAVVPIGQDSLHRRLIALVEPRRVVVETSDLERLERAGDRAYAKEVKGLKESEVEVFLQRLEYAVRASLASLLSSAPMRQRSHSVVTQDSLMVDLDIDPQYRPLLNRWLVDLSAGGFVELTSSGLVWTNIPSSQAVAEAWRMAEEARPTSLWPIELLRFFESCANSLLPRLQKTRETTHLLFERGRRDIASKAYEHNAVARSVNNCVADLVKEIASEHYASRPIRILELGAGTGATSASVLSSLTGTPYSFVFTDISKFFISIGKARFGDNPRVRFENLDINGGFADQGFGSHSFDCIVAAEVLHNTPDIPSLVRNIAELLTPGGWLILTEMVIDRPELMISMEFMFRSSCVQYPVTDIRKQSNRVFFTVAEWKEALSEAGADEILCFGDNSPVQKLGQRVLAARFKTNYAKVDVETLYERLWRQLPRYMIPSEIQIIDSIPTTHNGKVDRKALVGRIPTSCNGKGRDQDSLHVPQDHIESLLAEQWAKTLDLPVVNREDNLFGLGGDSLIAAQLASAAQTISERVPYDTLLRCIVTSPSISALAELIRASDPEGSSS